MSAFSDSSTSGQTQNRPWRRGSSARASAPITSSSRSSGTCGSRPAAGRAASRSGANVEVAVGGHHQRARDRRRASSPACRRRCPCASARRCATPKRCCSSIMASPRSRNATPSWNSACVPTTIGSAPDASSPASTSRAWPFSRPVSSADLDAGRRGEALQRLRDAAAPGSRSAPSAPPGRRPRPRQHRQQRDHGLAAADIALQQAQHAVRLPPCRRRSRPAPALAPVSAKRSRPRPASQVAGAGDQPAARRRAACAHQRYAPAGSPGARHRQAARAPGCRGRDRRRSAARARAASASRQPGQPLALAQAGSIHSGSSGARSSAAATPRAHDARRQPGGQRIDRLDGRQPRRLVRRRRRSRDAPSACRRRHSTRPQTTRSAPERQQAAAGRPSR